MFVCFPGEYAGFDESQPTAESGGKGKVISMLKEQYGFKTVVMIGDGATDLEASPPAVSVHIESQHFPVFCFMFDDLVANPIEKHTKADKPEMAPCSSAGKIQDSQSPDPILIWKDVICTLDGDLDYGGQAVPT